MSVLARILAGILMVTAFAWPGADSTAAGRSEVSPKTRATDGKRIHLAAKKPAAKTKDKKRARNAVAKPADVLPAVRGVAELDALIAASRLRLQRAANDSGARDGLGWAGITLAGWALDAEAIGDIEGFRRYGERIRTELHDTGWRIGNLAGRGWPGGWSAVGYLHENGVLLEKSPGQACQAYARAVSSPNTLWHVGKCQLRESQSLAAATMEQAAVAGHAGAQEWLARRCLGDFGGVGKDPVCAREWLVQAATAGRPSAQTLLAYLLVTGAGGAVDLSRANALYRQAADRGDANAQNNLGESYESGRGVGKDLAEAFAWYEKAAVAGLPAAKFNAGRLLAVGVGGQRDLVRAKVWLLAARKQGIGEADPVIAWVDQQLTATGEPQLKAADALSRPLAAPGLR